MDASTDDLEIAVREELTMLWGDLEENRRFAANGQWSIACDNTASRIVSLSRLVGATPWGDVPIVLLVDGTYERVYREAHIGYDPIDWERVNVCLAQIKRSADARSNR